MQTLRWSTLVFLIAATVFSGCLGSDSASVADSKGAPAASVNVTAEAPVETIYKFKGIVTGADAPSQGGDGSQVPGAPAAKTDHFKVEKASDLTFVTNMINGQAVGAGSARIEVYGPDGGTVYVTDTFILAGSPTGPAAGLDQATGTEAKAHAKPGDYTVRYLVAGAFTMALEVKGAAAPDAPAKA